MSQGVPLGDRMKGYEAVHDSVLMLRTPTIIRVDGKAFHTLTRGLDKPFDGRMLQAMAETARALCEDIQNAVFAYGQSDEISVLLNDWKSLGTQQWMGGRVQKMASIAASIATAQFSSSFPDLCRSRTALFDARVFNVPKEEVCNYFIWRQQDATRNSIQGLGQVHFSHKQLHNKNCDQIQEMLFREKGINWNDCAVWQKRGWCLFYGGMWQVDLEPPVFTQDRTYAERWLAEADQAAPRASADAREGEG